MLNRLSTAAMITKATLYQTLATLVFGIYATLFIELAITPINLWAKLLCSGIALVFSISMLACIYHLAKDQKTLRHLISEQKLISPIGIRSPFLTEKPTFDTISS